MNWCNNHLIIQFTATPLSLLGGANANWVVDSIVGVDTKKGIVYVMGTFNRPVVSFYYCTLSVILDVMVMSYHAFLFDEVPYFHFIFFLIVCTIYLLSPCEKHLYSMSYVDISQPVKVSKLSTCTYPRLIILCFLMLLNICGCLLLDNNNSHMSHLDFRAPPPSIDF